MKRLPVLAVVVASLAIAPPSRAQNYRELPIGGRTATMGGAGTAAGNDSAMPFLNPAGLAGVPGDIFAVSATVYSFTRRSFQDFFFPNGTPGALGLIVENESFSTSSVGELPSSVMYFRDLSRPEDRVQHRLGVSLVIPSARNVELVASLAGRFSGQVSGSLVQTASLNSQYRTYYVGPSYALAIGPDLRLGFSLYGRYQRHVVTLARSSTSELNNVAGTATTNAQQSEIAAGLALAPIAGVQARLVSDLWVGLGVEAPSLSLGGRSEFNSSFTQVSNRADITTLDGTQRSTSGVVGYSAVAPLRLNAGVAWDRRSSFSAAFDVHLYLPRATSEASGVFSSEERRGGDLTRRFRSRVDRRVEADAVVDLSIGAEYSFTKLLAMRAGFFTDVASQPEPRTTTDDRATLSLDRFGGSLGLGVKLGSFDTTAGMVLARGTGRYGAIDSQNTDVQNNTVSVRATETTAMFVLSGAVTVEEAKRAIRGALPFPAPLPDLDLGKGGKAPAPWIPDPLPAEAKPAPPKLRSARPVPPMIEPPPPGGRP